MKIASALKFDLSKNPIAVLTVKVLVLLPGLALAQNAEVNQRLSNQTQRIDNGLAHGTLTTPEAQRLQRTDSRVVTQEQRMQARDGGGPLTAGQDIRLNRELNRNSRRIYKEKHGG